MVEALLLGAIFGLILGVPVLATWWEPRLVWPYGDPQPHTMVPDPGSFGIMTVQRGLAAGFTFLGWCPDLKGKGYNLAYGMLVSPDRQTLAIVGVGKMFGVPLAATWLHSASGDRQKWWVTVNNPSAFEHDPLGQTEMRIVKPVDFAEQHANHMAWVATRLVGTAAAFAPGEELQMLRAHKRERIELMVRSGLVRFIDPLNQDRWRYTLHGAVWVSASGFWNQLRAMVWTRKR
ncbi:MAG: hypothetical protein K2W85_01670 [Phycisphaerales bacterium]|nr:hypothetical protein [Phycisphaerales bacterium]